LFWTVADFAPLLLKRTLRSAGLTTSVQLRERLMRLADSTMQHLIHRKIHEGEATGLWDDPAALFPHDERDPVMEPSWYFTERVVEALVVAAGLFQQPPLRSQAVINRVVDLLHEADHLLIQLTLSSGADVAALASIEETLTRARDILISRPGTANALVNEGLRELDRLAVAALDAQRGR
jgi:hypothetical protein